MQLLDNATIKGVLQEFYPLRCWKVGLSYGSCLYFYMKDQIVTRMRDGSETLVGSCELVLYGDDWSIFLNAGCIADSRSIDRELAENVLQRHFFLKELCNIIYNSDGHAIIQFDQNKTIIKVDPFENSKDEAESIVDLFFPDGRIMCINRVQGPHFVDEISRARRKD